MPSGLWNRGKTGLKGRLKKVMMVMKPHCRGNGLQRAKVMVKKETAEKAESGNGNWRKLK